MAMEPSSPVFGSCSFTSLLTEVGGHGNFPSATLFVRSSHWNINATCTVVNRLHPYIVDPIHEVSRFMGDLTTHCDNSPGPLRPHFILWICRYFSLNHA